MNDLTRPLTKLFVKSNVVRRLPWPDRSTPHDYHWITHHSGAPWIDLKITIPIEDILKEIKINTELLVNHRDDYGEHYGWKSFCIHGKSLTTTQHCDDDRPFHWIPEIIKTMPRTVEYFQSWGVDFYRLRVMALEPGGFVSVHSDSNQQGLGPMNIAITQPIDCQFVMEGWGVVPFETGKTFMLDTSNRHAVVNNSNEIRYHIIAHYKNLTDEFKNIVEQSYLTC
jgi:hypothetical protein